MNILIEQLAKDLPSKMVIPEPLKKLYQWIEKNGLYIDSEELGKRIGFLYPTDKLKESWTDGERDGGTYIEFYAESQEIFKYWFGQENDEILSRLYVFAKSGAEGSTCALWLDDNNETKIVHMGSGSGSMLCCILANDAIDFLRLLAIGYDEICWNECFALSPNSDDEFIVHPNVEYQNWVKQTFDVEIPLTALEIVKHPSEIGDRDSLDAFCLWCCKQSSYTICQ